MQFTESRGEICSKSRDFLYGDERKTVQKPSKYDVPVRGHFAGSSDFTKINHVPEGLSLILLLG